MEQFILVWLLGGTLTVIIWKWIHRQNRTLGLIIGSFAAALTLTPSIVVGHGYVVVPAILVFVAMPSRVWLYYAWLPIFVTWLLILGIALVVRVVRSRRTKTHEDAA